ncbi:hypothetical protein O181_016787 [Austropuccinia psidii MF-1]|uniref:Uncharacterized protein n=1 Tax=Austropuccinia psidii MF-1 TaxID=1389203 RepID=A0A9Q3GS06_9BASI|nr:hypothetical protein [Austropuccinia psidii MF-1]
MGNFSKPLAGDHELLLTHQELSGSGEYHRALRRMESFVFKRQVKKNKELVKEEKTVIHIPKEGAGNDPSFAERSTIIINQLQNSKETSPKGLRRNREVSRAIKAREMVNRIGAGLTHKGTGFPNWNLQP